MSLSKHITPVECRKRISFMFKASRRFDFEVDGLEYVITIINGEVWREGSPQALSDGDCLLKSIETVKNLYPNHEEMVLIWRTHPMIIDDNGHTGTYMRLYAV